MQFVFNTHPTLDKRGNEWLKCEPFPLGGAEYVTLQIKRFVEEEKSKHMLSIGLSKMVLVLKLLHSLWRLHY
jgi:hypothetical protein